MVEVFTSPQPTFNSLGKKVFLAGSIEMGEAKDWQQDTIEHAGRTMRMFKGLMTIYNPRRPDWDSTLEQKIENPQFSQQVNWELDHIQYADCVIFYFQPGTKSPITLMELGEVDKSKDLYVICPDGYWRKGNVDIYCQRHRIRQFEEPWKAMENYIANNFEILPENLLPRNLNLKL